MSKGSILDLANTTLSILEDGGDERSFETKKISLVLSIKPSESVVRERMTDGQVITKILRGDMLANFSFSIAQGSPFYSLYKEFYLTKTKFTMGMKGYRETTIDGKETQDEIIAKECYIENIAEIGKFDNDTSTSGHMLAVVGSGIIDTFINNDKDIISIYEQGGSIT